MSTKYCSNILKIITLAFIAVIAGTKLQMVNDVQQHEGRIQSLSNFTLESRNSGYPLVYNDEVKLKKPILRSFTEFGLGMGPEFSSDIAGDGPRKRIDDDDEYDPEVERIKKKKLLKKQITASRIEKGKDPKLRDKLIISSRTQKDPKLREKLRTQVGS